MIWLAPLIPLLVGLLVWGLDRAVGLSRTALGATAAATLPLPAALVAWASATGATTSLQWGAGLTLRLELPPLVTAMALLVPAIALPVLLWASSHESRDGLGRLVGLTLAFAGAMELLVLAADLLTLIVGWELVSTFSWALIGHQLGDDDSARDAAFSYNATRLGGLGLFVAAGAALATTGSFAFADLSATATSPWGDLFAAGILLAAASKSAQLPFSLWLFRAMAGPSSVSALLHSSTMVAAGAWLLVRLHQPLSQVPWFDELAIALGLATALAGGLVASAQSHAKRLLAASTSAHYGLMFAAVGAGAAGVALAHLVTHAAFKSLLFLTAGTAIGLTGSHRLDEMRLGGLLPTTAAASAAGSLALAGIPPLGAAWSKEKIIAALGHHGPALALLTIAAGALSAWYAGRFHFLAFGRSKSDLADPDQAHWPGLPEKLGMGLLALATVLLSLLWLPAVSSAAADALGVTWPAGPLWETITAIAAAVLAALGAWFAFRPGPTASRETSATQRAVADWLTLPALVDRLVTRPTLALADACTQFDDQVVDAGLRTTARLARALSTFADRRLEEAVGLLVDTLTAAALLAADRSRMTDERVVDGLVELTGRSVGQAAPPARKTQTGALPRYYTYIAAGLFALVFLALIWR